MSFAPPVWIEKKIAEEPMSVLLTHIFNAYPYLADLEGREHCIKYVSDDERKHDITAAVIKAKADAYRELAANVQDSACSTKNRLIRDMLFEFVEELNKTADRVEAANG